MKIIYTIQNPNMIQNWQIAPIMRDIPSNQKSWTFWSTKKKKIEQWKTSSELGFANPMHSPKLDPKLHLAPRWDGLTIS